MTNLQSSATAGAPPPAAATRRREGGIALRRVVAVILGWMSACWLVLGLLVSPVVPGGWLTVGVAALLTASPLLALARWFGGVSAPSALARLLVLRPFWYAQLFLPLLAAAGLLGALVGLAFSASGTTGRIAVAVLAVILAGMALYGYIGSRRVVLRSLDVLLPQLPRQLSGLRIAQLSDLHVGPHTSRRHLRRISEAVRAAQPDLLAITGDQVDDYPTDVAHFAAAFGDLSAPLGVFVVPGNHDVYAGWGAVRAGLERMGLQVLVNEAAPLEYNGARFWMVGTGDPAGKSARHAEQGSAAPDVPLALSRVAPGEFSIALAHNPVLWPQLVEHGVPLTLSGHTHHGQFSIPRLGWCLASAFLEHAMGPYQQYESLLYIHPGSNFWGIPFRIGALPEVTLLTLRRAPDGQPAIVPATNG